MSLIKKKPGPKKKLTPVQEGRVVKIVCVLMFVALLWIFLAPGSGIFTLLQKRSELKKLQQDTAQIEQQIDELQNEIDRLHNDPEYLEEIARKDFGLLKKNERVFDFSKAKPEKNEK
ncbi:MAG: septum formation initiator family protein [Desulforhopalus sp.]